jgi:hypothetical protein
MTLPHRGIDAYAGRPVYMRRLPDGVPFGGARSFDSASHSGHGRLIAGLERTGWSSRRVSATIAAAAATVCPGPIRERSAPAMASRACHAVGEFGQTHGYRQEALALYATLGATEASQA